MSGSNISVGDLGQEFPEYLGSLRSFQTFLPGDTQKSFFSAPAGGSYFITRIFFQISTDAIIATAGNVILQFSDSNDGVVAEFQLFLPHVVVLPTTPTFGPSFATSAGFFYTPPAKETDFDVSLSVPLTGGSLRVAMNGGTIPTFVPPP